MNINIDAFMMIIKKDIMVTINKYAIIMIINKTLL